MQKKTSEVLETSEVWFYVLETSTEEDLRGFGNLGGLVHFYNFSYKNKNLTEEDLRPKKTSEVLETSEV
ncbi:MAG: hypothetical protein DRI57_31825 [Deltaproteobacteria bacterium]|nr:MAG: hypothetical protein DRI57_31825 [Deltaproteobacteria bacterium]